MSLYTTEVRYICEEAYGADESSGQKDVNKILDAVWSSVIPQEWPIFDEAYRPVLCKKILKHYYTREIGLETVGLWKLKLETKLAEIMPYYNELYQTKLLKFDPFHDTDYYREHEGSGAGTNAESSSDSSESESENWNVYSDTPQGALTNVKNDAYLTDARKVTDNSSASASGSREGEYSNTDQYIDHVYGKMNSTSYMSLIKELRETLINIDMMIINDLADLFFLLWR